MARFNRTFYDLNNERCYCFAVADDRIPSFLLSDLKLSVPNFAETPFVSSILIKGETVRVTIAEGGQIVAAYSSDSRSMLRTGKTYTMKSWKEGYEGILVFGDLRRDVYYTGNIPISEECLTRYQPSAIPYISIPCTDVRLTGEVVIGGDKGQTHSFVEEIPFNLFGVDRSMLIDLMDTGLMNPLNPLIYYANGINAFNDVPSLRSPIYSIYAVGPNADGTVFVKFGDHFQIAAVVKDVMLPIVNLTISEITVGTDITQDNVCHKEQPPVVDPHDPESCPIEFVTIEYA